MKKSNRDAIENEPNYCDEVQAEVTRARGTNTDDDEDNAGQESTYASIAQDDFTRCEMYSLVDSSCKVRFYHNNIDSDKHFQNGDHMQVIFLVTNKLIIFEFGL